MKETKHFTGHRWTDAELKKLMQLWAQEVPLTEIANALKSSNTAILKQVHRMRQMGVPLARRRAGHITGFHNKSWTQGEMEYVIRRRNEKATNEQIGIELGRTHMAIQCVVQKLRKEGVEIKMRGNGVRRLWDAESLKVIASLAIPA